MARIRSVHPGLFRDEDFVLLSDGAQILLIGLGTFADDQGVFPWKPATIKMELRAASTEPVEPLLAEIEARNFVCRFVSGDREYAAIRNFRKHQRPKTPNSIHPTPPHIRIYVGLDKPVSETVNGKKPPFPPEGEINLQMEDGGGRREDEGGIPPKPPRGADRFDEFWKAYPHRGGLPDPEDQAQEAFASKLAEGFDASEIIDGAKVYAIACKAGNLDKTRIMQAKNWLAKKGWRCGVIGEEPPESAPRFVQKSAERMEWEFAVGQFRRSKYWPQSKGPKPGEPEFRGPPELLTDAERANLVPQVRVVA